MWIATAAGGEGQAGVLMTGTRPAKMGQNLSNDVQDKTADISGSGRELRLGSAVALSQVGGMADVKILNYAPCISALWRVLSISVGGEELSKDVKSAR